MDLPAGLMGVRETEFSYLDIPEYWRNPGGMNARGLDAPIAPLLGGGVTREMLDDPPQRAVSSPVIRGSGCCYDGARYGRRWIHAVEENLVQIENAKTEV